LKIYKNDYLQEKAGDARKDISGIEILKVIIDKEDVLEEEFVRVQDLI